MTTPLQPDPTRTAQRRTLLALRAAIPSKTHAEASRNIFAQVDHLLSARNPALVGAYLPIRNEPDPLPWIEAFTARGGRIALPAVTAPGAPLTFYPWAPGQPLIRGPFGTRQPADQTPVIPELLLIPVLGFSREGYRLGYGAGFYDRTLSTLRPRPFCCGIGFSLGFLPQFTPQPWDEKLDVIVTERANPCTFPAQNDAAPLP